MNSKSILQTLGTIISIILGLISIEIFKFTKNMEEQSSIWSLVEFFVMFLTFYIMVRTGISFFKSRTEHEGINHFLYLCLAIVHFSSIPVIFIVGMVIDWGKYWWVVLIGIIIFVVWADRNANLLSKTGKTVE